MSEKYKFRDPHGIYFVTCTVVHWIDLFTRKEMKQIILESLKYCQAEKGLIIHSWCLIHNNPVENEIVDEAEDYLYSSARDYAGKQGLIDVWFCLSEGTRCKRAPSRETLNALADFTILLLLASGAYTVLYSGVSENHIYQLFSIFEYGYSNI